MAQVQVVFVDNLYSVATFCINSDRNVSFLKNSLCADTEFIMFCRQNC